MAASLTWPVFLAGLIGTEPGLLPVLALLEVMVWFAHPIAVALSAFAAVATAVSASRLSGRARFRRYAGASLLAALALSRVLAGFTPYEHQRMNLKQVTDIFRWSCSARPGVAGIRVCRSVAMPAKLSNESPRGRKRFRRRLPARRRGARGGNVPDSVVTGSARLGRIDRVQILGRADFDRLDGWLCPDAWRSSPVLSWTARKPALIAIGSAFFAALAPKRDLGQADNPVRRRPSPGRLRMRTAIIVQMDQIHSAQSLGHRTLLDSSTGTHAGCARARRRQLRHLHEESRSQHHMVQQSQWPRVVRPGSRRGTDRGRGSPLARGTGRFAIGISPSS